MSELGKSRKTPINATDQIRPLYKLSGSFIILLWVYCELFLWWNPVEHIFFMVSVLAMCRICFMYNTAKVGKCWLGNWITYITFAGIYSAGFPLCATHFVWGVSTFQDYCVSVFPVIWINLDNRFFGKTFLVSLVGSHSLVLTTAFPVFHLQISKKQFDDMTLNIHINYNEIGHLSICYVILKGFPYYSPISQ